jgi:hypothetical protein
MQIMLKCASESLAALGDSEVEQELGLVNMRMSHEDAIVLFYTGAYSNVQWNAMASSINKLMDPQLRRKFGGTVPVVNTIKK